MGIRARNASTSISNAFAKLPSLHVLNEKYLISNGSESYHGYAMHNMHVSNYGKLLLKILYNLILAACGKKFREKNR